MERESDFAAASMSQGSMLNYLNINVEQCINDILKEQKEDIIDKETVLTVIQLITCTGTMYNKTISEDTNVPSSKNLCNCHVSESTCNLLMNSVIIPQLLKEEYEDQIVIIPIVGFVYSKSNSNAKMKVWNLCIQTIESYNNEKKATFGHEVIHKSLVGMRMQTLIQVFQVLDIYLQEADSDVQKVLEVMYAHLLVTVSIAENELAGKLLGAAVHIILKSDPIRVNKRLADAAETVEDLYAKHGQKTFKPANINLFSERPYMIMCGLANWFFPKPEKNMDMDVESFTFFQKESFWHILQAGFFHSSTFNRKRSMYLLKRILDMTEKSSNAFHTIGESKMPVFWWDPAERSEFTKLWNNYILLLETLEEKQVHVIKPLMPRMKNLIKSTQLRSDGPPLLHTSWLTVLFQRAASHESASIVRWGVMELLSLDLGSVPLLDQHAIEFFSGPFVDMIADARLYQKTQESAMGLCPPCAEKLCDFFSMCSLCLNKDNKVKFFHAFFWGMKQIHWSGPALFYVARGLAEVTACPILDQDMLGCIKELLSTLTRTLECFLRGAIHELLFKTIIKLLDLEKIKPADFVPVIGLLKRDECLFRGCSLWTQCITWLQGVTTASPGWSSSHILTFIKSQIAEYLSVTEGSFHVKESSGCVSVMRFLLLCRDAGLKDMSDKDLCIEDILQPVISILQSVNSHAYMSVTKADRAYMLMYIYLQESQTLKGDINTKEHSNLLLCPSEIIGFIKRRITQDISELHEVLSIQLYTDFLGKYLTCYGINHLNSEALLDLVRDCVHVLQLQTETSESSRLRSYGAISLLSVICVNLVSSHSGTGDSVCLNIQVILSAFLQNFELMIDLPKPPTSTEFNFERRKAEELPTWGRIFCEFIAAQWKCVHWFLSSHVSEQKYPQDNLYAKLCLQALDVVVEETAVPILQCLHILVPQVEEDLVNQIIQICWSRVKEELRNTCFLDVYSLFVKLAYQPCTLKSKPGSCLSQLLHQCANEILSVGEERLGMVNLLSKQLLDFWTMDDTNLPYCLQYKDIITKLVMFGPVHSKGFRYTQDCRVFIENQGPSLSVNQLLEGKSWNDSLVRISMVSWLTGLEYTNSVHTSVIHEIMDCLIQCHRDFCVEKLMRNYANTIDHRQKHRIVALLLSLDPFVNEENGQNIFEYLVEMLVKEVQLTVRTLLEWFMVRILKKFPQFIDRVLETVHKGSKKKAAVLCSYFAVLTNTGKLNKERKLMEAYIDSAIRTSLPWCMAHHFSTRTYAQATIITLWNEAKKRSFQEICSKYHVIDSFIDFHQDSSSGNRNAQKLTDNHAFVLHPEEDFSIKAIYHTLPRLSGLLEEEWIPTGIFQTYSNSWLQENNHCIPLELKRQNLDNCEPGSWRLKPIGIEDEYDSVEGDVQKKIVPWNCMLPEEDLDPELQADYNQKRQRSTGLVLVTSLINKVPNLGGLCRTSEIFGISEFVVGSIRHVKDPAFQSLSVTAHKWIPIREVKPGMLKDYLLQKRQEGYTLVGAEQTANSISLTDYQFPFKTLLLLGNEKEGIPVEIIQLLDACVEIPQRGIIRSLNVHVSGALLVWEYTRQQMLNKS